MIPIILSTKEILELRENVFSDNRMIWMIVLGALTLVFLYLLWSIIRKFFYHHLPIKEVRVEIMHISEKTIVAAKEEENDKKFSSSDKSINKVRIIGNARKKYKKIYLSSEGLRLGDVGILKYQGKNGVEFKKEGSNVADKENRYYHFGFNRK